MITDEEIDLMLDLMGETDLDHVEEADTFDDDPRIQFGPSILLSEGERYNYLNPDPKVFDIKDVAQSLAQIPRYSGKIKGIFYSVAQHSVLMSYVLKDPTDQKWALIHDFFEAYSSDIPSPLKAMLPFYKKLETICLKTVADKYNLPYPYSKEVKEADYRMYVTESYIFGRTLNYGSLPDPYDIEIIPWNWKLAERLFISRFYELFYGERYQNS